MCSWNVMNDHRHKAGGGRGGYRGPVSADAIRFLDHHHAEGHDAHETRDPDAVDELLWRKDNVELTTVGIDIGSATSHLMFARVHLHRLTQSLSSRFVVVRREVLHHSDILLTPFLDDGSIDAAALGVFVRAAYDAAKLAPRDVDSGAVLLTGEAIKRRNAQAIAALFAAEGGRLVCASAGHHMEAVLAAHGSGATALSRREGSTLLNVDVGGGTTKLALIRAGEVCATAALAVGGRLLVRDRVGTVLRLDGPAVSAAEAAVLRIALGAQAGSGSVERLVTVLADAVVSTIRQQPDALARALHLTEPLPAFGRLDGITFSGGVSEYLYGRTDFDYGDIARPLAEHLRAAIADARLRAPLRQPAEGLRATVIGASQFSVQASGNTVHLSPGAALPLRDVPVLVPDLDLGEAVSPADVAAAVRRSLARVEDTAPPAVALALRWQGDPLYARLRALAEGLAQGVAASPAGTGSAALVLLADGDVGRLLGRILEQELNFRRPLICLDDLTLHELDFVDIGAVIQPAGVVPVVIKSLLFHHD